MIWPKDQSGLGIKQYLGQKADLKFEFLGFLVLQKRLHGVGGIWPKDSLVLIQPCHQGALLASWKTQISAVPGNFIFFVTVHYEYSTSHGLTYLIAQPMSKLCES